MHAVNQLVILKSLFSYGSVWKGFFDKSTVLT